MPSKVDDVPPQPADPDPPIPQPAVAKNVPGSRDATSVDAVSQDAVSLNAAWRRPRSVALFLTLFCLTLVGDLTVKSWAFRHVAGEPVVLDRRHPGDPSAIPYHEPIIIVPNGLALRLTTNTGAVFGIGQGRQWFFALVSIVATVLIVFIFVRSPNHAIWFHTALALILAGALGNLYDRLTFNAVRDMFWLFPGVSLPFGWTWPGGASGLYPWIFNVADVALIIGVLLALICSFTDDRQPPGPETDPAPDQQTAPTSSRG